MKKARTYTPSGQKGKRKKYNPRKKRNRLYNNEWNRYVHAFLSINQKCFVCNALAMVVDHIVPHKGDEHLFKKLDNHMPMCSTCHNTATAKFDRHEPPKTEEKIKWVSENRNVRGLTNKIKVMPRYGKKRSRR